MNETSLHDYQKACIRHIIANPFCGVFLDMGLGKTVSTLTAINLLINDYLELSTVLVIAPKRVVESVWQEEAKKWEHLQKLSFSKIIGTEKQRIEALYKKANIYLISRDNISWLCSFFGGEKIPFEMVVIDESSSFKSYKSIRFKALRKIRPQLKRLVALTGTPSPNNLLDLWPQLYLIDQGKRLEKTITRYREKYFRPGRTNGQIVFNYTPLENSSQIIYNKIKDICISMKASDYLEMPMLTNNILRLKIPDKLYKTYQSFEREKVLELISSQEISVLNAAGLSNKLLQFANGAIYDENKEVHAIHNIKLEALKEIIENSNGQSILVAWTYQFDRDRIKEYLKEYSPVELKGQKEIQDWNAGKIQVLLAHPASAGHGLNLQAGGHIIVWFGQTWSLELYQQFNARLYRQGQQQPVIIHHLVLDRTHDLDVIEALKRKDKTQESLMQSIKAKIDKYTKNYE